MFQIRWVFIPYMLLSSSLFASESSWFNISSLFQKPFYSDRVLFQHLAYTSIDEKDLYGNTILAYYVTESIENSEQKLFLSSYADLEAPPSFRRLNYKTYQNTQFKTRTLEECVSVFEELMKYKPNLRTERVHNNILILALSRKTHFWYEDVIVRKYTLTLNSSPRFMEGMLRKILEYNEKYIRNLSNTASIDVNIRVKLDRTNPDLKYTPLALAMKSEYSENSLDIDYRFSMVKLLVAHGANLRDISVQELLNHSYLARKIKIFVFLLTRLEHAWNLFPGKRNLSNFKKFYMNYLTVHNIIMNGSYIDISLFKEDIMEVWVKRLELQELQGRLNLKSKN